MSVKTTIGVGSTVAAGSVLPYTGVSSTSLVLLSAVAAGTIATGVLLHHLAGKGD